MYTPEEMAEHGLELEVRKLPRRVWTELERDVYWTELAFYFGGTLEEYKAKHTPGAMLTDPCDPRHHAVNFETGTPSPFMFLAFPKDFPAND